MFRVGLVGETAPNSILFLDGLRPSEAPAVVGRVLWYLLAVVVGVGVLVRALAREEAALCGRCCRCCCCPLFLVLGFREDEFDDNIKSFNLPLACGAADSTS